MKVYDKNSKFIDLLKICGTTGFSTETQDFKYMFYIAHKGSYLIFIFYFFLKTF